MNVIVYSGPEVIPASLNHVLSTLRSLLLPQYAVQQISAQALQKQPWFVSCALLVFPRCFVRFPSTSNKLIQEYVERGGAYLALGAGAQRSLSALGERTVDFSSPKELPLRFYDQIDNCYIYPRLSESTPISTPRSVSVRSSDGSIVRGIYELGISPEFEGVKSEKVTIARYVEDNAIGAVASIATSIGLGKIAIWAPGIEYPLNEDPALSLLASSELGPSEIDGFESSRKKLFKTILTELGIQLPPSEQAQTTRPLPQFLVSVSTKPTIVSQILNALSIPSLGTQLSVFKDNDTFDFHPPSNSASLMQDARTKAETPSDPSTWQPINIVVCSEGQLPHRGLTPLFDLDLFFKSLSAARAERDEKPEAWGLGEALLYGEAVTSTQTMFDKNPKFMASLPTPIVSLASQQLAGRGRGNNVWLSPSGCLQFSILLRVESASFPMSKLVFVQYLFALAVVEACHEESVLGKWGEAVRLKWPNDLYAIVGRDDVDRKKIGGILVNTSFSGTKVDIVIGCGLNVQNAPPITSISQLLPADAKKSLSMEGTAAAILVKFEAMWAVFLRERGSFDSFMDLYLKRWLHSDQLVTLTTTTPPTAVRITGITSDYGLLRTIPERSGWPSSEELGYIDLQPDGNSFDLMAGMIKLKK